MTTLNDPVPVAVPSAVAQQLARRCTLAMSGHEWQQSNIDSARHVLGAGPGELVVHALAERLARSASTAPGWAVLALPTTLNDEQLQRAAAGVLAAVGRPFNSIDQDGQLWIGRESSTVRDAASFGGNGFNALHIDAPNVERIPDYTALLVLRPDPAGGGASLLGDLHAGLAVLDERDREVLRQPEFFEGRADGLRGVGAPRLPFPVLDQSPSGGRPWIRWAAKMLGDDRNSGHVELLRRFAEALEATTSVLPLARGQILVVDQQRVAHGREALGDQRGLVEGRRRWLVQAKAAYDPAAPAQAGEIDG